MLEQKRFIVEGRHLVNEALKHNILEEVIYTISMSISANYDVENVIFNVENEEIHKSVLKSIE